MYCRIFLLLLFGFSVGQLQAQVFSPQSLSVEQLSYWDSQSWDYALIDLRQPFDYRQGHILGAVNIPWPTLTRKIIQELRTEVVVLYSNNQKLTDVISHKFPYRVYALLGGLSGDRSSGFPQARSGAYSSWSQAGYPVVTQEQSPFAESEERSIFMDGAANVESVASRRALRYEGLSSGRPGPYASVAKKPHRGRRNYRNKQPRATRWRRGRLRRRARLLPTR